MKLVTGQLQPSKGSSRCSAQPIWRNPALLLPHRLLPRAGRLLRADDRARVGDRARPARTASTRTAATRRPRRALEAVDLADAADKKIGAYSKGMRQRVKLAQAIAHDPELLDPRRAAVGHGSAGAPEDHPPDQGMGARGQERHRVEPHPARNRVDDLEHPADQPGPHPRRRRTSTRFAISSTSIRTRCTIKADEPRALARELLADDDVLSLRFEDESDRRADGQARRVLRAADRARRVRRAAARIHEVTSPDDNLQAVFQYLVK